MRFTAEYLNGGTGRKKGKIMESRRKNGWVDRSGQDSLQDSGKGITMLCCVEHWGFAEVTV